MNDTTTIDIARKLGASAGRSTGSWAVDARTSEEEARRLLKGYEDGDPAVFNMQPSPLSGEWADGLTEDDVLDELELYADAAVGDDERDDVIHAWLEGWDEGYWDEVVRAARRAAGAAA